jgi:hypothetical protein
MRIMNEQKEYRDKFAVNSDEYDPSGEEKTMVAMSLLKSMEQLSVALEQRPEMLLEIESYLIPCVNYTIENDFVGKQFI